MIRLSAQYRVKPETTKAIEHAIGELVEAIRREEPRTNCQAFRFEDGVSFLHVMTFPDETARRNHEAAPYTLRFVEALYPYCEEAPVFKRLDAIAGTRDSIS